MSRNTTPVRPRRRLLAAAAIAALAGVTLSVPGAASAAVADSPADAVQRTLDKLVNDHGYPGALASVRGRDGKVRDYTAGVGDLETKAEVPVNGRVRIASNTKMFTAVVALQLAGEGRLDLDAPIEKYLPKVVRGAVDGRKITTRQLLRHTAGLGDYDDVLFKTFGDEELRTHREPYELVRIALDNTKKPVKGWSYTNTGYILAGLIIQKVTGRPIGEEITKRIITPLGLRDTYWPRVGELGIRGPHPKGYVALKPGDPFRDVTRIDPGAAWSAGAIVSTPGDLNRFMVALIGGELLKPAQLKQMRTTVAAPQFDTTGKARYGLGIATFKLSCGKTSWTHGGTAPGYASYNAVTDDGKAATIVVTALPTSLESVKRLESALDTALCN